MHTYHKIWLHYVWSTKKRDRIITSKLKQELIGHFKEYANENDIYIDTINGDMDHMHVLSGCKPKQSPSEIANLLKGESSNWINKNNLIRVKFAWQSGFSVFSVSESQVNKVRQYINNQEDHHRKKSIQEELDQLLKKHGVS